jgi:hypothetical protein
MTGTQKRKIIFYGTILLGVYTFLMWLAFPTLPSKPPILSALLPESAATAYVKEFSTPFSSSYGDLISPDERWALHVKLENNSFIAVNHFHSLRLKNLQSGTDQILFTLWDADPGSGIRYIARWSTDSKALQITGETQGFSSTPPARNLEYDSFNFIYTVEDDELFALPKEAIKYDEALRKMFR